MLGSEEMGKKSRNDDPVYTISGYVRSILEANFEHPHLYPPDVHPFVASHPNAKHLDEEGNANASKGSIFTSITNCPPPCLDEPGNDCGGTKEDSTTLYSN